VPGAQAAKLVNDGGDVDIGVGVDADGDHIWRGGGAGRCSASQAPLGDSGGARRTPSATNSGDQDSGQHLNWQPRRLQAPIGSHRSGGATRTRRATGPPGRLGRQCKSGSATPGRAESSRHKRGKQIGPYQAVRKASTGQLQQPKHFPSASL
jgi:hypothetical protein